MPRPRKTRIEIIDVYGRPRFTLEVNFLRGEKVIIG